MEININMFHERPMFSFRCSKSAKKKIKKAAKEMGMDVETFILSAVHQYMSNQQFISLEKLRTILAPSALVFIRTSEVDDPKNLNIVKRIDCISHVYDKWKVAEIIWQERDIGNETYGVAMVELELEEVDF